MKCHELTSSIQRNGLAPLYLVVGEEDFLRDQAAAMVKAAVRGEDGLGDLNCDLFYGDESAASDILNSAREIPVFATHRLVLVKSAEKLAAREAEALLPYLTAPNDSTSLVFVAAKLDGRLKFSQALKQKAVVVDCGPLPSGQLPGWVRAEASRLGLDLSEDAALLLAELGGESLSLAKRELEKLSLSVPQGRAAGAADVEALRGSEPGASVFDLAGAIGAGDRHRVLRILARNIEAGEAPLRILGSLVWQYRRIWKAKALVDMGAKDGEIGRALAIPPFRLRDFLGQVRRFSATGLREAFRRFPETDSALKGGRATDPDRVLESLLLQLCDDGGDGRRAALTRQEVPVPQPRATAPGRTKPISTVRTIRSGRPSAR